MLIRARRYPSGAYGGGARYSIARTGESSDQRGLADASQPIGKQVL